MRVSGKKYEIEPIDENHVRVNIREGDKVVSVVIKIVTERAANIIKTNRERAVTPLASRREVAA